jgi:type II secretory pathway component PulL
VALDEWTSTQKQAMSGIINYYLDFNWTVHEMLFAFDDVYVHPDCDFLPLTNHRLQAYTQESSWLGMNRNFKTELNILMSGFLVL